MIEDVCARRIENHVSTGSAGPAQDRSQAVCEIVTPKTSGMKRFNMIVIKKGSVKNRCGYQGLHKPKRRKNEERINALVE